MTNNNRSEISLDTGNLPCGFAYISRHSHHTLFQVLTLADIVHFGLLSPPCTFPGIQIMRHSEYRFFALSSTAGYLLSGFRQRSHPVRIFSGIFRIHFIYCRLGDCRLMLLWLLCSRCENCFVANRLRYRLCLL